MIESDTADLREQLVLALRILEQEGLLEHAGHVSVRIPGQQAFLMNSNVGPCLATVDDVLTLDFDGRVLDGRGKPNLEWPLHACAFLARPDVGAVAHTHAFMSRLFSVSPVKLVPLQGRAFGVFGGDGIPIYEGSGLVNSMEQGEAVAAALGSGAAVLLRGHGDLVAGPNLQTLVCNCIDLDNCARLLHGVLAHGTPLYYQPEERAAWQALPLESADRRAWNYYVERLRRQGQWYKSANP